MRSSSKQSFFASLFCSDLGVCSYLSKRFYFGLPVTKEWQEQDVVIKAINEIRSKAYGLDPIKAGETFTLSADLKEVDYDDEPQAWADMMGEW